MGLTISSENYSYDLGYFGFASFRFELAERVDESFAKLYKDFFNSTFEREKYYNILANYVKTIDDKEDVRWSQELIDFFFASDCEHELSLNDCESIFEKLEKIDDEKEYGYSGRIEDKLSINNFKKMLKDAIDNKSKIEWF